MSVDANPNTSSGSVPGAADAAAPSTSEPVAPRRTVPPVTREEVAAYFPPSYYYGGYYYDDFGYDGPYSVGPDGRTHRVCRHFLQGRCTWGTSCRFAHDVGQPMTGEAADDVAPPFYGSFPPPPPPPGPDATTASTTAPAASVGPTSAAAPPSGEGSVNGASAPPPFDDATEQLAYHQATLQARRHAVLVSALKANFQIRQLQDEAGVPDSRRGQVTLTDLANVPNIVIEVLEEAEVVAQLQTASTNPRIVAGGLHYLVGEASLFWSMMRLWHVNGKTGSLKWDALLDAAHNGLPVACMFYRSTVGCAVGRCAYLHTVTPLEAPTIDASGAPVDADAAAAVSLPSAVPGDDAASDPSAQDAAASHPPTTVAEGW